MDARCFDCGSPADHAHHVVPRSLGGTKTVPLCNPCHRLVHGGGIPLRHRDLVRAGQRKAAAEGRRPGRPKTVGGKVGARPRPDAEILELANRGRLARGIALDLGITRGQVYRALRAARAAVPQSRS